VNRAARRAVSISPGNSTVTCVIKTNPGEHFSAITMISTMISLDAYETLTRPGRDLAPLEWLALRGSMGKEIDYGN